ncbi:MAG: hypothetical protein JXR05_10095 [Flavobacteriaceae bacterium]
MEKLTTLQKNNDLLELLIRVGDLAYFEGPLLSLYENAKTGHLFLLDWVDRDKINNRWIIYRVDPIKLMKFLNRQIPHLDLFNSRPKINVYVVDIPHNGRLISSEIKELYTIPAKYTPNSENYFDKNDSISYKRIVGKLNRTLSLVKSQNEMKQDNLKTYKIKYRNQPELIKSNIIQGSISTYTFIKPNVEAYNLDFIVDNNSLRRHNQNYRVYNINSDSRQQNIIKHKKCLKL